MQVPACLIYLIIFETLLLPTNCGQTAFVYKRKYTLEGNNVFDCLRRTHVMGPLNLNSFGILFIILQWSLDIFTKIQKVLALNLDPKVYIDFQSNPGPNAPLPHQSQV